MTRLGGIESFLPRFLRPTAKRRGGDRNGFESKLFGVVVLQGSTAFGGNVRGERVVAILDRDLLALL